MGVPATTFVTGEHAGPALEARVGRQMPPVVDRNPFDGIRRACEVRHVLGASCDGPVCHAEFMFRFAPIQ
jgi:hypothetical protein